jgi:hypothetical protein
MSFSQVEVQSWPSRDCRAIAVIRPEPADLGRKLGITFRDDRDDLDELKYAGLRLPGGDQILLVRHQHVPGPGTEVYGDVGADSALLLARFLAETGLSPDQVSWQAPATESSKEAIETIEKSSI